MWRHANKKHEEAYKLFYDEIRSEASEQSGGPGGRRVAVITTRECHN